MGKLRFLEKEFRGEKSLKYVILHPVFPIGTVMAIFYARVSFKLATFLFQQVVM